MVRQYQPHQPGRYTEKMRAAFKLHQLRLVEQTHKGFIYQCSRL
jgi:hypothetical protein